MKDTYRRSTKALLDANTERIDALQRTIIQVGGALTAATLGVLAAMLGMIGVLLATQL